eukprot:12947421-Heterocapsa_arctica.AAC.1
MLSAGIALRLQRAPAEFWAEADPCAYDHNNIDDMIPVVEVAFVDDEGIMLSAPSPSLLDRAISILLESARQMFSLLELEINWKPGKTECCLRYRGNRATHHLQKQ